MARMRDLFLPALLLSGPLHAQPWLWGAPVPLVTAKGVHAITLSAELLGSARSDLGDIRLLDSTGTEVPYVLREVARAPGPEHFVAFNLLRNAVLPHRTELEIERPAGEAIEELHVWIKPIDAEKRVRITGSDDRRAWYMVKDEHVAVRGSRGEPPHQVLVLRTPRSDYRYLRLTLNDSLTAPMKVLGIGRFVPEQAPEAVHGPPVDLPFTRKDSARWTILRVASPNALLIERLAFTVQDTAPFLRTAELSAWRSAEVREGRRTRTERWRETMGTFTIQRRGGCAFSLMPARLDTFEIRIDNGDDLPLRISAVSAQCRQRVLLARLEPGMRYRVVSGQERLSPPRYDLAHFAEELPVPLDTMAHGSLERLPEPEPERPRFDPSSAWVWAAIIALMLGMGWMAVRMLRKDRGHGGSGP
jgi:hypothetical protein